MAAITSPTEAAQWIVIESAAKIAPETVAAKSEAAEVVDAPNGMIARSTIGMRPAEVAIAHSNIAKDPEIDLANAPEIGRAIGNVERTCIVCL